MPKPSEIVRSLLEAEPYDPDDIDLDHLIDVVSDDTASGKITYQAALDCGRFYHRTERYSGRGGKSGRPYEARRNGKTKTWVSRPGQFKIPIKIGLYQYGSIDNSNADEWSTVPDFEENAKAKAAEERARKFHNLSKLPVKPLPADAPPPPPDDPQQLGLFNEHRARLRKLGLY
jgi:hypothetical protein